MVLKQIFWCRAKGCFLRHRLKNRSSSFSYTEGYSTLDKPYTASCFTTSLLFKMFLYFFEGIGPEKIINKS